MQILKEEWDGEGLGEESKARVTSARGAWCELDIKKPKLKVVDGNRNGSQKQDVCVANARSARAWNKNLEIQRNLDVRVIQNSNRRQCSTVNARNTFLTHMLYFKNTFLLKFKRPN